MRELLALLGFAAVLLVLADRAAPQPLGADRRRNRCADPLDDLNLNGGNE
jgi:hypothetical protein